VTPHDRRISRRSFLWENASLLENDHICAGESMPDFRSNLITREYTTMSDLLELSESAVEMVAGGVTVGPIVVQNNLHVNPQVAVGIAVLSPNARVNARNNSFALQLNVTAVV